MNRVLTRNLQLTIAGIAIVLVFSSGLLIPASAQSAQDFFHTGAKGFIGNKLEEAAISVDNGLAIAPDDSDLLSLKGLIEKAKEEQQKQQEEQEQQNQQDQEQQDQQDSGEESDQEQEQQEDEQNQDQQQEDEQTDEEKQGGEQKSDSEGQGQGESAPENAEPDPDQLSREEAERILQALENEEGQLLREVQKMKVRARRVEKDW